MSRLIPLLGFLLAIAAVAVQGCLVPAEYVELAAKVRAACMAETGTTEDVIDDTCNGNFPDDEKLKCYMKCIVVQLDMLQADGDLNYDLIISMIPAAAKDRLLDAVHTCRHETGSDLCDSVYNKVKCVYKVDRQDFFMP